MFKNRVKLLDQIRIIQDHGRMDANGVPVEACVADLVSWLHGEPFSDRPKCLDPRLAALLRTTNDSMPASEVAEWARTVAPLVPTGDASELLDRLAVRRLRETVLPLAPSWPEDVRDQVVNAIKQVIDAIENDGDRKAAESAAKSAAKSAGSRAGSGAWSAARSAELAEESAELAAWSASAAAAKSASGAWSGAWSAEATRILEELARD